MAGSVADKEAKDVRQRGGRVCSRMKIIRVGQQSKEKQREVKDRSVGSFNQSVVKQATTLVRL